MGKTTRWGLIVALSVVTLIMTFLLWGPVVGTEEGALGGPGSRTTQYGIIGWMVVHSELYGFDLYDIAISRRVVLRPSRLGMTIAVTIAMWPAAIFVIRRLCRRPRTDDERDYSV
jgi:hypothetical protein